MLLVNLNAPSRLKIIYVHFLHFELGGFELVFGLARASHYPKKEDNLKATF
jgi:hypothetical protein